MSDDPYFLEIDNRGCKTCSHGKSWMIVAPGGVGLGVSYENEEEASELCDQLNTAYNNGMASLEATLAEKDAEIAVLNNQLENAEAALRRKGYVRDCHIAACNCGSQWNHGGHAEERLREISDVLPYTNGKTILQRVEQLQAELDRVMGALDKIMIGGNHLALQITNSFGEHPLHDASFEEAAIFYKVGVDGWDGQAWKYDVWICWKSIMQARPIFESWRDRQGKT